MRIQALSFILILLLVLTFLLSSFNLRFLSFLSLAGPSLESRNEAAKVGESEDENQR